METLTVEQLISKQKQEKQKQKEYNSKMWKEYNSKKAKAERLEEEFRRERNTRWAKHKGMEDTDKWYDEGNRMPHELELKTIQLKMENYLLKEIFEMFDRYEVEAEKRTIQKDNNVNNWFVSNLERGGRVNRADAYKRAVLDGVLIQKKDFFSFFREKGCRTYKTNGNMYFSGWSLKQPETCAALTPRPFRPVSSGESS